jgi:sigma-B regulation protein RsbU (phosphoserine phosphatase)
VFGILGPATGSGRTVSITYGGHPPALLLTAAGTAGFVRAGAGPLIGVLPDIRYTTTALHLGPGDTLILYTDGLTDARTTDPDGRYGSAELLDFARRLAPTSAPAAVAALTDLLATFGAGLDDDAAVMALSITAGSGS